MSASACVRGMLTKLSVVPVWIRRRSPVPLLSQSLELLKNVFHNIHQNFDGIPFSRLHFMGANIFVQDNKVLKLSALLFSQIILRRPSSIADYKWVDKVGRGEPSCLPHPHVLNVHWLRNIIPFICVFSFLGHREQF